MIYMNRYALINNQNIVENIVLWDGESDWQPPENMTCVNVEDIECNFGWIYDGAAFTAPEIVVVTPAPTPETTPPTREELLAQLQTLTQQVQSLT